MPKSGFAVLVGRSNVGKSTLLNALAGSKLAITTPKPQTTRKPVQGIINDELGQIVFIDTPGVMQKSRDTLTKKLLQYVKDSLKDVDVVLYVVDPTRDIGNEERQVLRAMHRVKAPKILVLNKLDQRERPFLYKYEAVADEFDATIEVSALKGSNLNDLKELIFSFLPEGEPYFPDFQMSTIEQNEWIAELIREKLFLRLRKEVPYSIHVVVDEVEERDNDMLYIAARVLVNQDRYRKMVIGKGGRGIKEIGQAARKELEVVFQRKVFLDLEVEVDPYWVKSL